MTDHHPVAGKGHIGDIVMTEAIAKLTVRSCGQPVFNGPDKIAAADKNGENKKNEQVTGENCHDTVPWINRFDYMGNILLSQ
jgi:hypothetical protein